MYFCGCMLAIKKMPHNFTLSLFHEREQASIADNFYRNQFKVSEIIRFNTDTEADMEMQLQDVDVLLTLNGITYRVSEKFRDADYGDLYVEVYSKYPKTLGWLHTGTPNAILYFTPKAVHWITHKSLKEFCLHTFFPLIQDTWYEDLFLTHKKLIHKEIQFQGESIKINLIQAHNQPSEGKSWETIGISAPFSFFEKYGVKIKKFDLLK